MSDHSISRDDGFFSNTGNAADPDWWNRLYTLLEQKTGLLLTLSRTMVSHLLQDRLNALGLSDLENYFSLLNDPVAGQREWPNLLSQWTVNESYFFRDPDQLSVIEKHLLPELLAQNGRVRDLTLWSAGCASGEETYTLAMILNNLLSESAGAGWRIRILGTDIDADCIKRAQQGCYRSWSFRHIPQNILATCFRKEADESYRVDPRLAAWIQFMELNLLDAGATLGWRFRFDLVLCRNVFIYLSPRAVQRISATIHTLLAPGGYLVTGHGEVDRQFMERIGYVLRMFPHSQVYQKPVAESGLSPSVRPVTLPGSTICSTLVKPKIFHSPTDNTRNSPPPIEDICNRMRRLIAEGNNALAQIEGESSLSIYTNDAHIRTLLAWALANLGKLARAEETCWAAIRLDPTASAPHYLLGQILSDSQRFSDALQHFQTSVYLNPGEILAMIELGNTLARLGRRQEALREWQAALDHLLREPADRYLGPLDRWPVQTLVDDLKRMIRESL
ncbi:MAG: hypothetical protein HQL77_05970 [Magnetococcales bacterium]|nr:hypothetical protein [Magnetococcales bacterium]